MGVLLITLLAIGGVILIPNIGIRSSSSPPVSAGFRESETIVEARSFLEFAKIRARMSVNLVSRTLSIKV